MYGCKASLDEHWVFSQFPAKLRASLYPCVGSRAVSLPGAWPVLRAKVNDDDFLEISKMYVTLQNREQAYSFFYCNRALAALLALMMEFLQDTGRD
jgi:hypothetical protein